MGNTCPVCSSDNYTNIGKPKKNPISSEFINKDYRVVQCNNCNVYYVSPKISFSDEQWSKLYNSEYFTGQSNWLLKKRQKELNERFRGAEHFMGRKESVRLLDIGTGEGKTLIAGIERNWDVTGIDIVDNRIPQAKTDKINFIKDKFIEYDFPENFFDFIYLDSVLEHVQIPLEYLIKMRRILKPGGIIYIGVPNEDSLFNDVKRLLLNIAGRREVSVKIKPFDSPYHIIGFNTDSIKLIIEKAGLKVKYLRNFGRKLGFLSFSVKSKAFWVSLLFLFPFEILGYIMKKDVYLEAYITKPD